MKIIKRNSDHTEKVNTELSLENWFKTRDWQDGELYFDDRKSTSHSLHFGYNENDDTRIFILLANEIIAIFHECIDAPKEVKDVMDKWLTTRELSR